LGDWGGSNAGDNRTFINGCFWIIRTGAPWRDLPPQYGKFNAVHRRYKRWCDNRHWEYILAELIDDPDMEWLMIDGTHCKVHPSAIGAVGGNQDMERSKGGVDANGMPIRLFVTAGTTADCKQAVALIDGFTAEYLLADRGL